MSLHKDDPEAWLVDQCRTMLNHWINLYKVSIWFTWLKNIVRQTSVLLKNVKEHLKSIQFIENCQNMFKILLSDNPQASRLNLATFNMKGGYVPDAHFPKDIDFYNSYS